MPSLFYHDSKDASQGPIEHVILFLFAPADGRWRIFRGENSRLRCCSGVRVIARSPLRGCVDRVAMAPRGSPLANDGHRFAVYVGRTRGI